MKLERYLVVVCLGMDIVDFGTFADTHRDRAIQHMKDLYEDDDRDLVFETTGCCEMYLGRDRFWHRAPNHQ